MSGPKVGSPTLPIRRGQSYAVPGGEQGRESLAVHQNCQKSAARVVFGIIRGVDATFKWRPAFRHEYLDVVKSGAQGQSRWLLPWFHFWVWMIAPRVGMFA